MARLQNEARLRAGLSGLAAIIALGASLIDDATARRHNKERSSASSYSPAYAAIVVDGHSGTVLHAAQPDALRHPASLTKIMTLSLLFARL